MPRYVQDNLFLRKHHYLLLRASTWEIVINDALVHLLFKLFDVLFLFLHEIFIRLAPFSFKTVLFGSDDISSA